MTAIRFETLAELRLTHEYYRDEGGDLRRAGADVRVEPTPRTVRALRAAGVLFKPTEAGCVLLYEVEDPAGSGNAPRRPLTGRFAWHFALSCSDPYLHNYSDLPLERAPGQLFSLGNVGAPAPAAGQSTRVTAATFLSGDDLRELAPERFTLELSSPVAAPEVTLEGPFGDLVLQRRVVPVEGRKLLSVDLRGRPPGRYRFTVEGVPDPIERHFDPELHGRFPLGVVTLTSEPSLPAHVRFADASGNPEPKTFGLALDRRRTVWRYYVALKYLRDADPSELSIESTDPAFSFTARAPLAKAGLATVVPFDSGATSLPFRSQPLRGVRLRKSTAVTPGALDVDDLPNPAPDSLREEAGTLYSEAFIYI